MKILVQKFYLAIFLVLGSFILIEAQQQQNKGSTGKGTYVPGRNNIPRQMDGSVSRSEMIKIEQKQKFKSIESTVPPQVQFKQFIFTIQGVEDYFLNLPVTQQIYIQCFTYVMIQNAYLRPSNIQNQPPIKIYIYQNNNRIIHQSDFYFQNYISFEGQQDSTYTIRFINSGPQKLIIMNLKKLMELSHVQKVFSKEMTVDHSIKASRLLQQLKFIFNGFERYTVINFQAVRLLFDHVNLYYYWQIGETIIAVLVCLIQVKFIRKICKQQSIV